MRDNGTAYLRARAGLHIAFAAFLAYGLTRGGQFFSTFRWIRWHTPLLVGSLCAISPASLTVFQSAAVPSSAPLRSQGRLKYGGAPGSVVHAG